jgi:hypothetical protein
MNQDDLARILARPGYAKVSEAMATRLRHPKPEPDARKEPLAPDQVEKGSSGRFEVCITRVGTHLLDFDNGVGGCKALIDALRRAGLIHDDDPSSIDFVFKQRKAPKKDQGTLIEIKPL